MAFRSWSENAMERLQAARLPAEPDQEHIVQMPRDGMRFHVVSTKGCMVTDLRLTAHTREEAVEQVARLRRG